MSDVLTEKELRATLDGRVIAPGDEGYDKARAVFSGAIDRRPAVIVQPADAAEVGKVVAVARDTGQELAIRSGGHSVAGHSASDGGIVLDLARIRGLDIDAGRRTAWAGSGLTAAEYVTAAGGHGLVTGFGDTGSVGIGGITLGGGIGFLVRKYGLTVDDLLAAELVTADGQLRRVDSEQHPDLFWAIRGGGGNFGVATRFQFRLHPLETVVGGILILPATPEVLHSFMSEAEAAPDELSTIANVMTAPPMPFLPAELHGQLIILAIMCYAGGAEAGEPVVDRFRALGPPLADMVKPISYPEMYWPDDPDYHPTAVSRNLFLDSFDRQQAETAIAQLQASDATMRVVQLRVLGGAVSRVPDDATAYPHRGRRIMANVAAFFESPEERLVRDAWAAKTAAVLGGDGTSYANFVGAEGEGQVRSLYPGASWDRLREVKRRYDPTNLFWLNHNIPPAEAAGR